MTAVVVYESIYGNTRAIAEAIAQGLGGATVLPISRTGAEVADADLLVVGGPTHMHSLATNRSRKIAVEAAEEDGSKHLDPDATEGPGLRAWLRDLPDRDGARAATFDTRLDKAPWFTGAASRGIAKRLRHHGYEIVSSESFLVEDTEGPLEDGELERARAWAAGLAAGAAGAEATARPGAGTGATAHAGR